MEACPVSLMASPAYMVRGPVRIVRQGLGLRSPGSPRRTQCTTECFKDRERNGTA